MVKDVECLNPKSDHFSYGYFSTKNLDWPWSIAWLVTGANHGVYGDLGMSMGLYPRHGNFDGADDDKALGFGGYPIFPPTHIHHLKREN